MFPCLHIIQCTDNNIEYWVECIVVLFTVYAIAMGYYVDVGCYFMELLFEDVRLWLADMQFTEVELSIEVGLFYQIEVDDSEWGYAQFGYIFDYFATNTTGTN